VTARSAWRSPESGGIDFLDFERTATQFDNFVPLPPFRGAPYSVFSRLRQHGQPTSTGDSEACLQAEHFLQAPGETFGHPLEAKIVGVGAIH